MASRQRSALGCSERTPRPGERRAPQGGSAGGGAARGAAEFYLATLIKQDRQTYRQARPTDSKNSLSNINQRQSVRLVLLRLEAAATMFGTQRAPVLAFSILVLHVDSELLSAWSKGTGCWLGG